MPDDVDIFRYTEISEDGIAILNPLTAEKQTLIGELAGLAPGMRQLDLGSGKGEMLCQFARRHGITGVGIDVHPPFAELARARAAELGVASAVSFVVGDAAEHDVPGEFDVVSCIGATWIGGGFAGSIDLMRRSLAPGGVLLLGEVFLEGSPPEDVAGRHSGTLRGIADLAGLLEQATAAGCVLEEMVLATREDWDRYSSRQWQRVEAWLRANPDHPDAPGVRAFNDRARRTYLADERSWLGWGVFVVRP